MAQMVWCNSCKTVVWAYDHYPSCHLSGIVNELNLPCPLCGVKGNFDGWGSDNPEKDVRQVTTEPVYDGWSALKWIAKSRKLEWNPSPDSHWFRD